MGSLNMVQLIGNLGKDAEMRYTPGGAAVANFNMATTDTWTDKDGNKRYTTEVKAHNVLLLSGGGGGQERSSGRGRQAQPAADPEPEPMNVGPALSEDDIPF